MIAIYEDQGRDYKQEDYEPVAVFADGEWLADAEGWEDRYPADISEEGIAQHLTGPNPVVVEVTENADELIERVQQREEQQEKQDADNSNTD
jgi:hypothetical protein